MKTPTKARRRCSSTRVVHGNRFGHDDMYTEPADAATLQLRVVGTSNPPIDLYVYSSHLKASTGSANQADRLFGIEEVLENAAELPEGSRIIYAGDYNIYTNSEPAYEALVASSPVGAIDPYGNGSWSGASNAHKHTQSPRASAGGGLIGGSLDDRFDFQVFTAVLGDGMGVDYMTGSLRAFGNDGNHYDVAINGNNTHFPATSVGPTPWPMRCTTHPTTSRCWPTTQNQR